MYEKYLEKSSFKKYLLLCQNTFKSLLKLQDKINILYHQDKDTIFEMVSCPTLCVHAVV